MARDYICSTCHQPRTTENKRGPVPQRCELCKAIQADPPRPAQFLQPPADWIAEQREHRPEYPTRQAATVGSVVYQDKTALALAMRLDYRTWDEIAVACGLKNDEAAYALVKVAMARRQMVLDETLDEIRMRELQRLDALSAEALRVLRKKHYVVNSGEVISYQGHVLIDDGPTLKAIDTLLKVSESRRKLLGLDAAQKVDAAVQVQYTVEGISEEQMP